jgi:hypothetical protein
MPGMSYYAIVRDTAPDGPTGLIRRRPADGGRVDEAYQRDGGWVPTSRVTQWHHGEELGWDLVLITEDEAQALAEWFQRRWNSEGSPGDPPLIGGRTLGQAWSVTLDGPAGEEMLEALLRRLGMNPHGGLPDRDVGLRVLRNDESARVMLDLVVLDGRGWSVALEYLGEPPAGELVRRVRDEVLAATAQLGLTVVRENTTGAPSVTLPPATPARSRERLFTLRFQGTLDDERLAGLQRRLKLEDEGGKLAEEEDTEFGRRYLPNDGTYRAHLWLSRDDERVWSLGVSNEGARPAEDRIQQWRTDALGAAIEAGLRLETEWLSPAPPPSRQSSGPAPASRSSLTVHLAYVARLRGEVGQEALDLLRQRLELRKQGRLSDDWDQDFGYRTLRDEPGTPVQLQLSRQHDDLWQLELNYQGDPPSPETVERVRTEILSVAGETGLTVEQEWR